MKNFKKKDLVEFGNYLLSKKRKATITSNKENRNFVNDVDFDNWKNKPDAKK